MNTITTTASTNTIILAIDLGKYKSVACVHNPATGEYRVTTFETTRAELEKQLHRRARELGYKLKKVEPELATLVLPDGEVLTVKADGEIVDA